MTTTIIKVVGFEKDLTFWAAEALGFFAKEGLEVSFTPTRNSKEEILGLVQGAWDIAFDNADNVVAWNQGQGADGKPHDLFIFMDASEELKQCLYAVPEIGTIHDLGGETLGVDAVSTGYAVILRYILQSHGLLYGRDYRLKEVGSSRLRLEALLEGKIAAAMLNRGYVERNGLINLRILAEGKEYAHPYPSRVGFASRAWAKFHGDSVIRFIRAAIFTANWMRDPTHKNDVIKIIREKEGCTGEVAEQYFDLLFGSSSGLAARFAVNPDALRTVLSLRMQTSLMREPLPPVDTFYDSSFYKEALYQLRQRSSD